MGKCEVGWCDSDSKANGYCMKHYMQMRRHGKILDRTRFDKNEIVKYEDYAEIVLYDPHGKEVDRALIDLEDVETVSEYKWCSKKGYVMCDSQKLFIHRLVTHCLKDKQVVHMDNNPLNNRKRNLRCVNKNEVGYNRSVTKRNKSGITGVVFLKDRNKWRSSIRCEGVWMNLGHYEDIHEATKVRLKAEKEHFKELAPQRHLFEEYNI